MKSNYFFEEYLTPLKINTTDIMYPNVENLSKIEISELTKVYMSLFNADNKQLINELKIKGRTLNEGIWNENPYTYERTLKIIESYKQSNYFGVTAFFDDKPLGACIFQQKNLETLRSKGYTIPFDIPENTLFWDEIDTFVRPLVDLNGLPIKRMSQRMREEIIKVFKPDAPVLMYSSTNNPQMVSAWIYDGWTIIEEPTTFGNRFQSFKLLPR